MGKDGMKVVIRVPKAGSALEKFKGATISLQGPRPQKRRGMPHPMPKPKKKK